MKKFLALKFIIFLIVSAVVIFTAAGSAFAADCSGKGGLEYVNKSEDEVCNTMTFQRAYKCKNDDHEHIETVKGTKIPGPWIPDPSTICKDVKFSQTNGCSVRNAVGTKPVSWTPDASSVPKGINFTQTNECAATKSAVGTKVITNLLPSASEVCSGKLFSQTDTYTRTSTAKGTKSCSSSCVDTSWTPDTSTVCKGVSFDQVSNCGKTRSARGIKNSSNWLPDANSVSKGQSFFQYNECGEKRSAIGKMDLSAFNIPARSQVCGEVGFSQTNGFTTVTSIGTLNYFPWWNPPLGRTSSSYCVGTTFPQINGCTTRMASGTNPGYFFPFENSVCRGMEFTQRQVCTGETRKAIGTNDNCPLYLDFSADKYLIKKGEAANLKWTSNAQSCVATDGWINLRQANGTEAVSPTVDTTYTLTCNRSVGVFQQIVKQVTINVAPCVAEYKNYSCSLVETGNTCDAQSGGTIVTKLASCTREVSNGCENSSPATVEDCKNNGVICPENETKTCPIIKLKPGDYKEVAP